MRRRGFLGILGGVATAPYFSWKKRRWTPFIAPPKVWIDGELVANLLEASLTMGAWFCGRGDDEGGPTEGEAASYCSPQVEDNLPKLTRPGQDSTLSIVSEFEDVDDKHRWLKYGTTVDLPVWMTEEENKELNINLRLHSKYWSMSGTATTVVIVSPLAVVTKVEATFRVWNLRETYL